MHRIPILAALLSLVPISAVADESAESAEEINNKAVQFTAYEEVGDWETFANVKFSIRLPKAWCVYLREDEDEWGPCDDNEYEYMLCDADRHPMIFVTVYDGGPEYVACMCEPSEEEIAYSEIAPYKIWADTVDVPVDTLKNVRDVEAATDPRTGKIVEDGGHVPFTRVIKVANRRYRLDIHLNFLRPEADGKTYLVGQERDMFVYIAESARPTQ